LSTAAAEADDMNTQGFDFGSGSLEPLLIYRLTIRILARGTRAGRPTDVHVELIHYLDETTGFTAMERLTGWHAAILMAMQARGRVAPGAHRMERAVAAADVLAQLEARGIPHTTRWECFAPKSGSSWERVGEKPTRNHTRLWLTAWAACR
jgi:hypothetical protein